MKAKTSKSKHASAAVVDSPPWQDADPVPPVSDDAGRHEGRWKTRIVGAGYEDPEQLLANPKNWRIHPKEQQDALEGVLDKVGWVQNVVVNRRTGFVVDGHLRVAMSITAGERVPVIYVDLSPEEEALVLATIDPLAALAGSDAAKLSELLVAIGTGDMGELGRGLSDLLLDLNHDCEKVIGHGGEVPEPQPPPDQPVSQPADVWLCGPHRVLCGDSTLAEDIARLLGDRQPLLMITDPPYGIELDTEWRDRAGLNGCGPAEPSYMKKRTKGHETRKISGDTRADWSEAFALVPSIQVAYVWHAGARAHEVLFGLLRIGFLYPQQIIWDKGRTVLTRNHYWYQHEPCWYVRKKNAPWFGQAGKNSSIWHSASPKFIMGGSDEEKFDHPTQKPLELMRRPILNHTNPGELIYEPFLGSGTTLAACELTGRVCCGIEQDPKYVDVTVLRWQSQTGARATLEGDGRTFEEVAAERVLVAA